MQPQRTWYAPQADPAAALRLAQACGLPPVLGRVLWHRGHRDIAAVQALTAPDPGSLPDPFAMTDMQRAATRLVTALRTNEHIVVNGDYDADGVTGTALLVSELRALGARVDFFIPDRERDGYGITPRLVHRSGEVGVRVLVSVDCGSSDHEAIAAARAAGIDVIVVDHHEISSVPADAYAVLNPKRADCAYPFKGLSAVGVAYKLLQALGQLIGTSLPADGLDLVALGTLADVQPVLGENRILVRHGLLRLAAAVRPGVQALRLAAGTSGEPVGSREVGFRLVPRLNAGGRMASAKLAVDLLLAPDARSADRLATEIEAHNRWRQTIGQRVTQAAIEQATVQCQERDVAALVVASTDWHPGVVGIAAARVADRFAVPTAVVGIQNGSGRGSVRSAAGVDVRAALDAAADVLVKFGGHREAAGFTIAPEHLPEFTRRFDAAVRAQGPATARPGIALDAELEAHEIIPALAIALDQLEPYGVGNPEPHFLLRGMRAGPRTRRVGDGHLKLELEADGRRFDAIGFGWSERAPVAAIIGQDLDLVVQVRRQDPRWGDGPQLVVADLGSQGVVLAPCRAGDGSTA